jgi:hypothetical protein
MQQLYYWYALLLFMHTATILGLDGLLNAFTPYESKIEKFEPLLQRHGINPNHIAQAMRLSKDGKECALLHKKQSKAFIFDIRSGEEIRKPALLYHGQKSYQDFKMFMDSSKKFSTGARIYKVFPLPVELYDIIIRNTVLARLKDMPNNNETLIKDLVCPPIWMSDNKQLLTFRQKKSLNTSMRCTKSYQELQARPVDGLEDTQVFSGIIMPDNQSMLLATSKGLYEKDLNSKTNALYRGRIVSYIHAIDKARVALLVSTWNDFTVKNLSSGHSQILVGSVKKVIACPHQRNQCIIILDDNNHDDARALRHNFEIITGRFETQTALDGSWNSQDQIAFIEQDSDTLQTTINVWDAKTCQKTESNMVNIHNMQTLAWCPKGDLLAIAAGKRLYLYNAKNKSTKVQTEHDTDIKSISWSPNGRQISLYGEIPALQEKSIKIIRLYDKELLIKYLTNDLEAELWDGNKAALLQQWLLIYLLMGYKQPKIPLSINNVIKHVNANSNVRLTLAGLTQVKDMFPQKVQYALGDLFDIHIRK